MAEISQKTKVGNSVTLRSGYSTDDGAVTVEVWYENRIIASFKIEHIWDFLADIFAENSLYRTPAEHGRQIKNYRDKGSRVYCMIAARWLRNILYEDSPHLHETMALLERFVVTRSPNIKEDKRNERENYKCERCEW